MDGQQNHGYLQDNVSYDDLINNAGWPAPGNQPYPSDPRSVQGQVDYTSYQTTQASSYDHFPEYAQPSYPQIQYSNSPYAQQPQYQSTRPSDFTSTAYLDPSLQNPRAGYGSLTNSFSFAPNTIEGPTISPYALDYGMVPPASLSRPVSTSSFQTQRPTNGLPHNYNQVPQEQPPLYFGNQHSSTTQSTPANTVLYPKLPDVPNSEQRQDPEPIENDIVPAVQRARQIQPSPVPHTSTLRMTREDLYKATNTSTRPRFELAPFVVWEDEPIEVQLGPKNALPKIVHRRSANGTSAIPGLDISQTLKPEQISTKKRGRPRKELNTAVSKYKGTAHKSKILVGKTNYLREDDNLTAAKSPSTPTETSSEDESSSEEDSEFEETRPVMDVSSVRGADRPTDASQAARWDAIGIVWKDPFSNPSSDVIKDAIEKYGSFVSTLRADLKSNSTKMEDAALRPTELTRLKKERDALLESLYQTIDAAITHGFPTIVENLGGHHKLVLGLTTTLIECIKASDYDGKLPKAVFILLAKFKTLTDELLKKLKFDSIQKRWNKKGNAEIKGYITTIIANTTDAKERAAKTSKPEEDKKTQDQTEQAKRRQTAPATSTPSNPGKRPHEGDGTNGKPVKKFASDVAGTPTSAPKTTVVKKPTANLLGIATKPTPKPAAKKPEPAPPTESKLGALLASIAKAPEPPKAPVAPARPPETPEQKARRERKESRRHLRVKFKEDDELTEIRYFKHEQAEDEGRQDEMLKDAHDDRLEGMMHKKRVLETIDDEDDDYQPPDVELPYTEPPRINFNSLAKPTRFGPGYVTRGGDLTVDTPEQKKQKNREESELMVVYTDPNDIPPSPKEPSQDIEDYQPEPHLKESNEPWLLQRVQEIHQYGPENASQMFLSRREEQMFREIRDNRSRGVADSLTKTNASSGQPASVATLLQQLKDSHTPKPASTTRTMDPNQYSSLLAAVNYLKGKPFPPTEPPEWMNEVQKNEWWEGYYRDNPDKKRELDERIQAQVIASQFRFQTQAQVQPQAQTQQYQPAAPSMLPSQFQQQGIQVPAPQMAYPQATNQSTDVAAQIQAYLAAYQQQQQNGAAPVANTPQAAQAFDFNAWAAQAAAAAAQSQNPGYGQTSQPQPTTQYQGYGQGGQSQPKQNYATQPYSNENRWDSNNNTDWENEQNSNSRGKESKKRGTYEGKNPTDNLFDENGEYKGKKKPCKFWREGKCAKGAKCTFLHE